MLSVLSLYNRSLVNGLDQRFKLDLRRIIFQLEENPKIFGVRFKKFRTANLNIFPYQVHYQIDEVNNTVVVFAVLHANRDPDFILKRGR